MFQSFPYMYLYSYSGYITITQVTFFVFSLDFVCELLANKLYLLLLKYLSGHEKHCIHHFLLFISICRAQDNNILFQNYNVSNGLSQNTVIRSLEDSNGVMWFCTRDGLNRFDGTEFEVFRADGQPHSLSSSDVTTIIEESPGVLWIGTHSGLNRYDVSSNTFTQYFHDPANQYTISDNCIKHLLCDNQKESG